MYEQIVWLYRLIEAEKKRFELEGLDGNFYLDFYTSGALEEFNYHLPAMFINYEMEQDSLGEMTVLLRLYIVIERAGKSSSEAGIENEELRRRLSYSRILREILNGVTFPGSSKISFKREIAGYFIGRTIEVLQWDADLFTQDYQFRTVNLRNDSYGIGFWSIGTDNIVS